MKQFDEKEPSILALDELFKGIGKKVAIENSAIKQQLEVLTKPSREISKFIEDTTKPISEISEFIKKIKIQYPKLSAFLKDTS